MHKHCVERVYAERRGGPPAPPAFLRKLILRNVYACLCKVYAKFMQSLRIPTNERKPWTSQNVYAGSRMVYASLRMVYAWFTQSLRMSFA